MILILKNDGTLSILEPTTLTTGSANTSDIILLSSLGYSAYSLSVELPNGNVLTNLVMSPLGQTPVANNAGVITTINSFYYHIDETWTKVPGILRITVYATNNTGGTLASYVSQINVVGVVPTDLPEEPSASVYEDILTAYGALKSIYDALYDAYEDIPDDIASAINTHNTSLTAHSNQFSVVNQALSDLETAVGVADGKAVDAGTLAGEAKLLAQQAKEIAESALHGERYIGMTSVNTLENIDTVLSNYVASEGYTLQSGDIVFVILVKPNETDVAYRYIYFGTTVGWKGYEIPSVESAGNFSKGLVQGNYTITPASGTAFMVSITNGTIDHIYIYNTTTGVFVDLPTFINSLYTTSANNATAITNIINGSQAVGNSLKLNGKSEGALDVATANKATNDSNNNNIVNTYQTKAEGATKAFVEAYALPKLFGNYYYLKDTTTLSDTVPEIDINYDGTVASESVVAATPKVIFDSLTYPSSLSTFTVNSSMSINSTLCFAMANIADTANTTLNLSIYVYDGTNRTKISSYVTNTLRVTNNTKYKVDISNIFSLLGDEEVEIDGTNNIIYFELTVTSDISGTFKLFSLPTDYLSFTRLDLPSAASTNVNYIGKPVEVNLVPADFTLDPVSGDYIASIPQLIHKQPAGACFFIDGYYNTQTGKRYVNVDFEVDSAGNITVYFANAGTYTIVIASGVDTSNIWEGTQAEYDALEEYDPNTYYYIKEN